VLHTIAVFDLDRDDFTKFLRSMAMDLTVTAYSTYADLLEYMDGSAAVIGTMMLPILGSSDPAAAREPARQLGLAFQLTNFIRDVAEDLDRGRTYLPAEHLAAFGVTRADLEERRSTPKIKTLIAYEVSRAREHYAAAAPGIPLLNPGSQACMRTAFRLYGSILDEVIAADYDIFTRRATVPNSRRAAVAIRSLLTKPGTPVRVPAESRRL
jgi:phytoene synthase